MYQWTIGSTFDTTSMILLMYLNLFQLEPEDLEVGSPSQVDLPSTPHSRFGSSSVFCTEDEEMSEYELLSEKRRVEHRLQLENLGLIKPKRPTSTKLRRKLKNSTKPSTREQPYRNSKQSGQTKYKLPVWVSDVLLGSVLTPRQRADKKKIEQDLNCVVGSAETVGEAVAATAGTPNVEPDRVLVSAKARLCRLCAQASSFSYPIKEKPETVEAVPFVLNFQLDEDPTYPDTVCRGCCTVLATFSQFKKTFEEGQVKLKEIIESKQRPTSPSNIIKTNTKIVCEVGTSEMSILPGIFSPFLPLLFCYVVVV
jgi:hypothetical protein